MLKLNQKVRYTLSENNRAQYLNQTVTDIMVDSKNYAFGMWNGKAVASFHIDSNTWFVL